MPFREWWKSRGRLDIPHFCLCFIVRDFRRFFWDPISHTTISSWSLKPFRGILRPRLQSVLRTNQKSMNKLWPGCRSETCWVLLLVLLNLLCKHIEQWWNLLPLKFPPAIGMKMDSIHEVLSWVSQSIVTNEVTIKLPADECCIITNLIQLLAWRQV